MRMDGWKRNYDWAEVDTLIKSLGRESFLADRIQSERQNRGMSQEKLSKAMAEAGYSLPQSAISKIENPGPGGRRAISVDEAIGLSKVLNIPLNYLLLPATALDDIRIGRELADLPRRWDQAQRELASVEGTITWLADQTAATDWDDYFENEVQIATGELEAFTQEHPDFMSMKTRERDERRRLQGRVELFSKIAARRQEMKRDA